MRSVDLRRWIEIGLDPIRHVVVAIPFALGRIPEMMRHEFHQGLGRSPGRGSFVAAEA